MLVRGRRLADGSLGHLDLIIAIRGDFEEGFTIHGGDGWGEGHVYLPWGDLEKGPPVYFVVTTLQLFYVQFLDKFEKLYFLGFL